MKEFVATKPDFNAQQSIVGRRETPAMPDNMVSAAPEDKSQDLFDATVKLHKDTGGKHIQMVNGAKGATFLIGEGKIVRERRSARKP